MLRWVREKLLKDYLGLGSLSLVEIINFHNLFAQNLLEKQFKITLFIFIEM